MGSSSNDDDGETKEEQEEQERLRLEAIKQAERERRDKYKKQEDERETVRQGIRDKVRKNRLIISAWQSLIASPCAGNENDSSLFYVCMKVWNEFVST